MTGRRFVALLGPDREHRRALAARGSDTLRRLHDDAHMTVLASRELAVIDLGEAGLLLGDLYKTGGTDPRGTLSADASAAVARSRGAALVEHYWGDYVAVLRGCTPAETVVVRAPLGGPPCLYTKDGETIVVATDVALLTRVAGLVPRVDWDGVARHLAASELRRGDTCLCDISELRGGDRLLVDAGRPRTETLWSPWRFTNLNRRLLDPVEAARRVRDAARAAVTARVPSGATALLLLSGGLDSSVVAACLAGADRRFSGLTVTIDDPTGDEREPARSVAAHLGVPLLERARRLDRVDLERSAAHGLPRPIARSFEQDSDAIVAAAMRETGATLVVGGGGGDNVFSSLHSVAPAADCLLARDGNGLFWRTAREVSALTGASLWTVARRAWARAHRPHRGYRWPADHRFLTPAGIEQASGFDDHPWLPAPPDALPGRAAHVALLAPAQSLAEDGPVGAAAAARPVLLAQPLVETCLGVPSWLWVERGCNRAVARRAFSPDLPRAVAWRRDKGTPDSFLVALLETNRALIRRLLLDGRLAAHGILDRSAVAHLLDDPRPTTGHDYVRVLQLVDVEVWARSW